jgi:hypothetical protein
MHLDIYLCLIYIVVGMYQEKLNDKYHETEGESDWRLPPIYIEVQQMFLFFNERAQNSAYFIDKEEKTTG